jgi:methionyl aminopeptidase
MTILLKTPPEIDKMRRAGKLAASVLEMIEEHITPGITTDELNTICHNFIVEELQAIPATLNYRGFPKSICTSVNNVVCHGIPSDKKLKSGDILNIDVTVIKDGYHGDTSKMFFVGENVSIKAKRLCKISHECMWIGIKMIKPGIKLGDIGHAIESHAKKFSYSSVHEFCGHGIGKNFHEPPEVLHFGSPGSGIEIQENMIFTVEPMINAGKRFVKVLPDQWTAVTKDRSLSAQWEHTVLVTKTGFEVLTLRKEEVI